MSLHPAAIAADVAALAAIVGDVAHLLPGFAGGLGAVLGCAWYGILIWDRLRGRRPKDGA